MLGAAWLREARERRVACHRGHSLAPVLGPGAGGTSSISGGFGGQGKGADGAEPQRTVRLDELERDQKGCDDVCRGRAAETDGGTGERGLDEPHGGF